MLIPIAFTWSWEFEGNINAGEELQGESNIMVFLLIAFRRKTIKLKELVNFLHGKLSNDENHCYGEL